jgi:hypothetical protein
MDIKIRMIGVDIYQLQYFLIEIDVDTQQWHGLDFFLSFQYQKEVHLWYHFISLFL